MLEKALQTMDQAFYNQSRQIGTMVQTISLLNDKISSIMTATQTGVALTDKNIDDITEARNEQNLKNKLTDLLEKGMIVQSDESKDNSIMVVRQLNKAGEVTNRRMQFVVSSIEEEMRKQLLGKKIGDSVEASGNQDAVIEVQEIYDIVSPKQEESVEKQESTETQTEEQA